jgi:hypothetical protein
MTTSVEHVQDAAFESLIRQYTARREWAVLELVHVLYGKVLSDREGQNDE